MRHTPLTKHEGHWAVGTNGMGTVLMQLQDTAGEQARVQLSPDECRRLARQLLGNAARARAQPQGLAAFVAEALADEPEVGENPVGQPGSAEKAPAVKVGLPDALAALREAEQGWDDALETMEMAGMHDSENYKADKRWHGGFTLRHAAALEAAREVRTDTAELKP